MPKELRSYERLDVREAQSNLALLWELDPRAFAVVAQIADAWANRLLESEGAK